MLRSGLLAIYGMAWLVLASASTANETTRVDDVPVLGELYGLSESNIHDAIVTFEYVQKEKPSSLDVISELEIHAHSRQEDFGWLLLRRTNNKYQLHSGALVDWTATGIAISDTPEVLHLLGAAEQAYVFPVETPLAPRRNDAHLRLLDKDARDSLERLLGTNGTGAIVATR
jgi:hypothetical protein